MRIILRNIGAVIIALLMHFYFYNSEHIKKIDYEFYDFIALIVNEFNVSKDDFYTVVVDIDEKSLQELGQWPWPRVIDSQLIQQIDALHPSAIGINILFPEEDRVSLDYIQQFYKEFFDLTLPLDTFPEVLKDNDKLLSNVIQRVNATLAIYLDNGEYTSSYCQKLSYRENLFSAVETKLQAKSLLCNYRVIQESSQDFGFINAWRDSDGIFRRLPLFMRYEKEVFPSFALATLLSFDKSVKVDTKEDTILVNFSKNEPKVFSAIDLLKGKVSAHEIQGKIVILGSSIIGLTPQYKTATSESISNNMIHAVVIDNLISQDFLQQPLFYKKINIVLSFFLSVSVIVLLFQKLYFRMFILMSMMFILSLIWLSNAYMNGIYISIAYLWTPFSYFFILMLIYHLRVIHQEQEQQDKFLIRQSKLASLGEIITLIAHQWRQPLSTINGIVFNIDIDHRKKLLDEEKLDQHLIQIEETTAYLSQTISDFTDFFSSNKRKESFSMDDIIRQSRQLLGLSNQQNIEILYEEGKEIILFGYKSELIQSLLIILNNAIYACQKNLSKTGQGKIAVECSLFVDMVSIVISDNGGGIATKDLKKIFDPYFTTKDKNHGTGLGLYILRLIVENSLNGKISVGNTGEGALFTITIPRSIT